MATIGPASDSEEALRRLIDSGMDVARLNFSHRAAEAAKPLVERIRKVADEMGVFVGILGDLRGPRIRVGEMENGSIELERGKKIILTSENTVGTSAKIAVSFKGLHRDVALGSVVLLDDGNLELQVLEIKATGEVVCDILRGGELKSNKGVNLKNRLVSLPSLTTKDYQDLDFAVSEELDFLALSFVQSSSDVRFLNQALAERGASIPVIAKIERKNALDDIENIVRECHGVMVARGDLALEMSFEDVPIAQKRIIRVCRDEGVPVITATQMLESMINFHKPTRAEAADVANAILDGTDAVMLSAESAVGRFPVEAVATMATIAARAEEAWITGELPIPPSIPDRADLEAAVGHAAHAIANSVTAKAIIAATASGATPRRVSCHRPKMPILALCSTKEVCRRLSLCWGVLPMLYEPVAGTAHLVRLSVDAATKVLDAKPEDVLTIVAGTPYNMPGKTNLIKVEKIADALKAEQSVE
ncbi:MAG: pyruvate kinase [Verrucomicrobia bacterium]|nr:pyruvate kinase [Verrucomicrobiota bacterium]MBV8377969.1 pyruvate kinase [Verrucomicrobiota bacterium]